MLEREGSVVRLFLFIALFGSLIYAQNISNEKSYEKLIVSYSQSEKESIENLLKLKVYFNENNRTRVLKKHYDLYLELETLDTYNIVVVKPITSPTVRNELIILLSPVFEDIFFIKEKKLTDVKEHNNSGVAQPAINIEQIDEKNKQSIVDEIGLQWLAILLLSATGLVLSIMRRRKIALLHAKQQALKEDQNIMEEDIRQLGAKNE